MTVGISIMKKSISLRARVFVPALCVVSLTISASVQGQGIEINPVVISASRMKQLLSEVSVVVDVVSRQQIEQSGASNVAEFLDSVGGLSVNRFFGRTGVDASVDIGYLGESGSQNVLIMIDGQRVNAADQSGIIFSQLPMSAIEQIEIRKANGGVLFGDRAQGGVINIITRTDSIKSVELSLGSYGYQKQDAFLGFQLDRTRGSVSFMNAKTDGYRRFSESDQRSAQVRLVNTSELGRVSFFIRGFEESANLPSYLTPDQFALEPTRIGAYPVATERAGVATGLNYQRTLNGDDLFSVDAFRQEVKDKNYDTVKNTRTSLTPEYKTKWMSNQLIVGGELTDAQANTDTKKQVGSQTQSLFLQVFRPMTKKTTVDVGARLQRAESRFKTAIGEATTAASAQKLGGSIGVLSQLTEMSTLRAGALTGFRFPNADELYTFNRSTYALLEINPGVKPMSTQEYFLQFEQRHEAGKWAAHYRYIDATDEIAYQFNCGVVGGVAASCNSNLYDTKRSIFSISSDWRVSSASVLKANVDFVDATIANGLNAGNRIPLTPKQVIRVSYEKKMGDYVVMSSLHHRSGMMQASDQSGLNPEMPSRTTVDLGLRTQFSHSLSGSFWIRNAFNKNYYDYAKDNGIYPADRRAIYANLKIGF
jgi:iron complex outermembrane receptor protein